jgi:hypothetical protein
MALLSLDRHDVLETIRQSNSLHEAFLRVAKLAVVGEYGTATNADRIRAMTDEELAEWLAYDSTPKEVIRGMNNGAFETQEDAFLWWLRQEETDD